MGGLCHPSIDIKTACHATSLIIDKWMSEWMVLVVSAFKPFDDLEDAYNAFICFSPVKVNITEFGLRNGVAR